MIGRAEVVAAATREQLAAFHDERYRPEEIVIAAAGSVDHDAIVALVEASAIPTAAPSGTARRSRHANSARPCPLRRRASSSCRRTPSSTTCASAPPGSHATDERRFALRVLEGILGGTSSSRLFQEVRERRGLAYAVFSFSNLYSQTGEIGLYVGTRPDNLAEALAVVAAELERLVEDPASEEELVRSRENLKGRVVLGMESTGARMSGSGRRCCTRCRSCR